MGQWIWSLKSGPLFVRRILVIKLVCDDLLACDLVENAAVSLIVLSIEITHQVFDHLCKIRLIPLSHRYLWSWLLWSVKVIGCDNVSM